MRKSPEFNKLSQSSNILERKNSKISAKKNVVSKTNLELRLELIDKKNQSLLQ